MKINSFKDLETYVYSCIILPLKGLNLPDLHYSSPVRDKDGNIWKFSLEQTPIRGEFRRNYQRNRARSQRNWWVILTKGDNTRKEVIGEYNKDNHWIKLWDSTFKESDAMPVFGKLFEAFDTNTPFTKVIVDYGKSPRYVVDTINRDDVDRDESPNYPF